VATCQQTTTTELAIATIANTPTLENVDVLGTIQMMNGYWQTKKQKVMSNEIEI